MKFIVTLLAVLAVGSVSATPPTTVLDFDTTLIAAVTGICNAVDAISGTLGPLTPQTQTQLVNIVTTAANRIVQEVNNLPAICNLTDNDGLISILLRLLGLADDIGDKVGNIIGFLKDAVRQIKIIFPASAANIDVAFNSLLCNAQLLLTTAIAGVNLVINSTISYDLLSFRAVIIAGQALIHLHIDNLKVGQLGGVLGAVMDQAATVIDGLAEKLLCLADKIATKGLTGLRNVLTNLERILVAFVGLVLVCV